MKMDYALGNLTRQRADGTAYWSFCMVWREGQSRKRVSLGTTDRIVAETTAHKVWAGIAKPDKLNTVGDIVDAYLDGLGA